MILYFLIMPQKKKKLIRIYLLVYFVISTGVNLFMFLLHRQKLVYCTMDGIRYSVYIDAMVNYHLNSTCKKHWKCWSNLNFRSVASWGLIEIAEKKRLKLDYFLFTVCGCSSILHACNCSCCFHFSKTL
jgi:hypothetical protein